MTKSLLGGLLAVALGGALGAMARYLVYLGATSVFSSGFPVGTLLVNLGGALVLGVLVETLALTWSPSMELRLFLVVGVLGGFTTFSTFALDVAVLYERGQLAWCALYLIASVAGSIAALFLGLGLARRWLPPAL